MLAFAVGQGSQLQAALRAEEQWAEWLESRGQPPRQPSYIFTVEVECPCSGPATYRVMVLDGIVVSSEPPASGETGAYARAGVAAMFKVTPARVTCLGLLLDHSNNIQDVRAAEPSSPTYHPESGHPTRSQLRCPPALDAPCARTHRHTPAIPSYVLTSTSGGFRVTTVRASALALLPRGLPSHPALQAARALWSDLLVNLEGAGPALAGPAAFEAEVRGWASASAAGLPLPPLPDPDHAREHALAACEGAFQAPAPPCAGQPPYPQAAEYVLDPDSPGYDLSRLARTVVQYHPAGFPSLVQPAPVQSTAASGPVHSSKPHPAAHAGLAGCASSARAAQ
eukprot:gene2343-3170_t